MYSMSEKGLCISGEPAGPGKAQKAHKNDTELQIP